MDKLKENINKVKTVRALQKDYNLNVQLNQTLQELASSKLYEDFKAGKYKDLKLNNRISFEDDDNDREDQDE